MIGVKHIVNNQNRLCTSCNKRIEVSQPYIIFRFDNTSRNFCLCEKCSTRFKNDINTEYEKFKIT